MKEQFGVQPWSQGDVYPAVIVAYGHFENGEEVSRDYGVLFNGTEVRGYDYDDAYLVAQSLKSGFVTPAQWAAAQDRESYSVNPHKSGMAPDAAFLRIVA